MDQDGAREAFGDNREHISYLDIYRERPIRLTVRALVPVKEHPKVRMAKKFNIQLNSIYFPVQFCW